MAEAKSKKAAPKVFDVAKPGKTAPPATSKPVIITHRPVLKDPMVVGGNAPESAEPIGAPALSPSEMRKKIQINPIHDNVVPEAATDNTQDVPAAAETVEQTPGAIQIDLPKEVTGKETPTAPDVPIDVKKGAGKKVAVTNDTKEEKVEVSKDAADEQPGEFVEQKEDPVEEPAAEPEAQKTDDTAAQPVEAEQTPAAEDTQAPEEPAAEKKEEKNDEPTPEEAPEPVSDSTDVTENTADKAKEDNTADAEPTDSATEKPADESTGQAEPAKDELLPEPSVGGESDEGDAGTPIDPTNADQVNAEEMKRLEEQEKIIDSQLYFLPINATAHKRAMRHTVIGLALILLFGTLLFLAALDANLIKIPGFPAPTDFL